MGCGALGDLFGVMVVGGRKVVGELDGEQFFGNLDTLVLLLRAVKVNIDELKSSYV